MYTAEKVRPVGHIRVCKVSGSHPFQTLWRVLNCVCICVGVDMCVCVIYVFYVRLSDQMSVL